MNLCVFQFLKFNLICLLFEATCLRNQQIKPQEIIEFPCLKIETQNFTVTSQFHSYVRPLVHPNLSEFCTELTGILQETVDNQPDLPTVLDNFKTWLQADQKEELANFAIVTCGDWDLKTCLPKQCEAYGLEIPFWAKRWINLKISHQIVHNGKFPRHLNQILTDNGLTFEGRPHSGIDDTKNIARAIQAIASKGHIFNYTNQSSVVEAKAS